MKGAVGTASAVLPNGVTVAALLVVNAVGSPIDPTTGELYGARLLLPGDTRPLRRPSAADRARLLAVLASRPDGPAGRDAVAASYTMRNTTIGIIATDAALSKAQCTKLAAVGHDGLARALNPVHTLFDGDTLFAVSTATAPAPDLFGFQEILAVCADVVTRAVVRGLLAAQGVSTPAGTWASYPEIAPSALMGDEVVVNPA
jgi:putative pantetheine hydrolase